MSTHQSKVNWQTSSCLPQEMEWLSWEIFFLLLLGGPLYWCWTCLKIFWLRFEKLTSEATKWWWSQFLWHSCRTKSWWQRCSWLLFFLELTAAFQRHDVRALVQSTWWFLFLITFQVAAHHCGQQPTKIVCIWMKPNLQMELPLALNRLDCSYDRTAKFEENNSIRWCSKSLF